MAQRYASYPDGLLQTEEPGRPTKCTPALIADTVALVRAGMYPSTALEHAGVTRACHSHWLHRAEQDIIDHQDDSVYVQYSRAVKQAESEAELEMVSRVREAANAGPQYWPAGMTYLERRHPDRWGKRERVEPPQHTTHVQIAFVRADTSLDLPTPQVRVLDRVPDVPDGPDDDTDTDQIQD